MKNQCKNHSNNRCQNHTKIDAKRSRNGPQDGTKIVKNLWFSLGFCTFSLLSFIAKTAPSPPKTDPRWPQDSPKTAQDGPKLAQDGPKIAHLPA